MSEIHLTLPVPPSVNHRLVSVRGRLIKGAAHRAYEEEVRLICMSKRIKPLKGDVTIYIHFYRQKKNRDLDGIFKTLFDCLEGFVYENDKQIDEIHAYRYEDPKNPRIEIKALTNE